MHFILEQPTKLLKNCSKLKTRSIQHGYKSIEIKTVEDAVTEIKDGMVVGIGTGSTIELLLPRIAELLNTGTQIIGVCTSNKTALLAKELGIKIVDVNDVDYIDVAIDGADEFDADLNLIKGGGGALFREKVIDDLAERFVVIADETKFVDYLGQTFKLPVEVDKFNWMLVAKKSHVIQKRKSHAGMWKIFRLLLIMAIIS